MCYHSSVGTLLNINNSFAYFPANSMPETLAETQHLKLLHLGGGCLHSTGETVLKNSSMMWMCKCKALQRMVFKTALMAELIFITILFHKNTIFHKAVLAQQLQHYFQSFSKNSTQLLICLSFGLECFEAG